MVAEPAESAAEDMAACRAAALLLLLPLLTAAAAAGGSEVAVEASGDGPEAVALTETEAVAPVDGSVAAELAEEDLLSAEPADSVSAAEAHRQDLATRPKQPKRTVDAVRPEQELRPQLRPSSATNAGAGFIASKDAFGARGSW